MFRHPKYKDTKIETIILRDGRIMETEHHVEGDKLIVAPLGKLDTLNAPQFLELLQELLSRKPAVCLLNLDNVTLLSSSGLQSLLGAAKISQKENIHFAVCCM